MPPMSYWHNVQPNFHPLPPNASILPKFSKCSQFANVSKQTATAISKCRGSSRSCSNCSAAGNRTHAFSQEAHPLILSFTSWTPCCWPAPTISQITSRTTSLASWWLRVYSPHRWSPADPHSHQLHYTHCRQSVAVVWSLQSIQHLFPLFHRWLELFFWKANMGSSRFTGRCSWWRSCAGKCWPIDWIDSVQLWRHSWCVCRRLPLSWELHRGDHFRITKTTMVAVISLGWYTIRPKSLAFRGGRL